MKQYIQSLNRRAIEILDAIPCSIKNSRNPFILAGAAIYGADAFSARKNHVRRVLTQRILSDATGIAEYSIRDHFCSVVKPAVQKMLEMPQA